MRFLRGGTPARTGGSQKAKARKEFREGSPHRSAPTPLPRLVVAKLAV
jgi:hypothetical protein